MNASHVIMIPLVVLMLPHMACGQRPAKGCSSGGPRSNDPSFCTSPDEMSWEQVEERVVSVTPVPGASIHMSQTVFTLTFLEQDEPPRIEELAMLEGHPLRTIQSRQVGHRFVVDAMLEEDVALETGLNTLEIQDSELMTSTYVFRQDERLHLAGVRFRESSPGTTRVQVYFSRPVTFIRDQDLCLQDTCLSAEQVGIPSSVFELFSRAGAALESQSLSISGVRDGDEALSVLEWQAASSYYKGLFASSSSLFIDFAEGLPDAPCVAGERCWGIAPLEE